MNKKPTSFAFLHFIITFFNDLFFIDWTESNIVNYIFVKIILLLFLIFSWNFGYKILKRKDCKEIIKYYLFIFIPLVIIFILIYPGIWYADDFNFLSNAKTLNFYYYLNYITSIYYSVSLSIFPFPSGIAIMQIIIYCSVVTYIVYNIIKIFNLKEWYRYLIYLIFLSPLILFYALYPNRPCIYGIFYLLFYSIIFFKMYRKEDLSFKEIIIMLIYSSVLAMWRSEGIYLLLFGPLLIWFISGKKNIREYIMFFIISFVSFFIISLPQNINTKYKSKTYSINRFIPSVINPLGWMLKQGATTNNPQDLENISKVIDINKMMEYPELYDTPCIWKNNCIKEVENEEDYEKFIKSYINYLIQNPSLFIQAKIKTFMLSSGIENSTFEVHNILNSQTPDVKKFKSDYHLTKELNPTIRNITLSVLEGRDFLHHCTIKTYTLINNLFIPLTFLIISLLGFILTKKLNLIILNLIRFCHSFIIFLTAPAGYFMYYYPVYLVGCFILLYDIVLILSKICRRKKI